MQYWLKLKNANKLQKHMIAIAMTFILPLLIVWFFPDGFIRALGYAGLCCSVLLIMLPFFMIRQLKKQKHIFKIAYINNNFLLYLTLFLGIIISAVQLFYV